MGARLVLSGVDAAIGDVADLPSYSVGSTITSAITVDAEPTSDPIASATPIGVTDVLPPGLTSVTVAASGWIVNSSAATTPSLVTASDIGTYPVAAGTTLPAIIVTGTVAASAGSSYSSTASASVQGDSNSSNDTSTSTVGISHDAPSTLDLASASGTYGGATSLAAHLTSGGADVAGEAVDFHLGASVLGTATTDANGLAAINSVSLGSLDAGTYAGALTASFAGDSSFTASSGSADLTVTPALLTIVASNQTKVHGSAPPTLTASYSGFANGDTPASLSSPVYQATAATSTSAAGFYQVGASGGAAGDHSVVDVAGALAIQPPSTPAYDPGQAAFVTSLYGSLLGRAPEPGGLAFRAAELSQGVPRSVVARRIHGSAEARLVRAQHHGRGAPEAGALALARLARKAAVPA